jgi:hypothetical protein
MLAVVRKWKAGWVANTAPLAKKEDMQTFHAPRRSAETMGPKPIGSTGIKIISFPTGQVEFEADCTIPAVNHINPETLTVQFAGLLDQPAMLPGFLGRRICVSGLPPATLDWLTLPGKACFATFEFEEIAARDFLLTLSRSQLERDDANLNWFAERVIGGFGSHIDLDTVQRIRHCAAPVALRFVSTSRPSSRDRLISLTEGCFCDAFIRVALCS